MAKETSTPTDNNNLADDSTNQPTDWANNSSLKGTRLEPIMQVLATQQEELKGIIISRSTEMLNLQANVKARFTKPLIDAAPNEGTPKAWYWKNLSFQTHYGN